MVNTLYVTAVDRKVENIQLFAVWSILVFNGYEISVNTIMTTIK